MKYKIAFTVLTMVLVSLLSFSNKCGNTCDGAAYISAQAPAVSKVTDASEMETDYQDNEAGTSPFMRMAVTL